MLFSRKGASTSPSPRNSVNSITSTATQQARKRLEDVALALELREHQFREVEATFRALEETAARNEAELRNALESRTGEVHQLKQVNDELKQKHIQQDAQLQTITAQLKQTQDALKQLAAKNKKKRRVSIVSPSDTPRMTKEMEAQDRRQKAQIADLRQRLAEATSGSLLVQRADTDYVLYSEVENTNRRGAFHCLRFFRFWEKKN